MTSILRCTYVLQGHPEMRKANQKLPTFLYVMPFSPNKLFLEETSLVSRPAFNFQELKDRLAVRYGTQLACVIDGQPLLFDAGQSVELSLMAMPFCGLSNNESHQVTTPQQASSSHLDTCSSLHFAL